ncbi:putative glutamine amidotransferase [Scopulibacillus darangshiensis]|uniref:Putative glutamine amidotransferase n=1 Tax=Scopulibacillus darangshiensis TaxID=442528 RepID=A0A4R2P4G4_9BACL|nr:gamma-glutamyl-gamma-aminobutyrate hydrolase family protein [Scopulibacillus darangshiensis]TCP28944.1 putative glutamine amidotransferase [Scopulibacillus darangshiensis]
MAPVIGLTADIESKKVYVKEDYLTAIINAGGTPIIFPHTTDPVMIQGLMDKVDGLLLTGGADIDPSLYGEEPLLGLGQLTPNRDQFEMQLVKTAFQKQCPILAICRGNSMLNIARGGSSYQDINSQLSNLVQHKQLAPRDHLSHGIQIEQGSRLNQVLGADRIKVNSFHHQAIKEVAPGFRVSAVASDGVIEGIESVNEPFVIGVQWHPGSLIQEDHYAQKLFLAFIQACMG